MRPRVLIVDDDPLSAQMLAEAVRSVGFLAASVGDAPSALRSVANFGPPELFIIDVMLPGMNGLDLIKELRRAPANGEASIFVITGLTGRASQTAALQLGVDEYFVKPCEPAELALKARNAIERHAGSHGTTQAREDLVVLFADVRGFTPLAERIDPETTLTILNDLFDTLDGAIATNGGHVDKFIGDALMAIFGCRGPSEEKELRACRAALEMQSLARRFASESLSLAPYAAGFGIGIGIACGEAVLGMVGTRRKRQLTAIGDPVNLASRLQGIAEGGEVVIDSEVARRLGTRARLSAPQEVQVKGKELPRTIYRLLGT